MIDFVCYKASKEKLNGILCNSKLTSGSQGKQPYNNSVLMWIKSLVQKTK